MIKAPRLKLVTSAMPGDFAWLDTLAGHETEAHANVLRDVAAFLWPLYGERALAGGESVREHVMGALAILGEFDCSRSNDLGHALWHDTSPHRVARSDGPHFVGTWIPLWY